MKKKQIRDIIIHETDGLDFYALSDMVNRFHVQLIERRLQQLPWEAARKVAVIDKIMEELKAREVNGIIE